LVALVLALQGFGVWSLVAGALTQSFMSNAMAVALVRHPWRPLAAGREAAQLLRFGTVGALNGAVAQTAFHGDNLVVGRLLGTSALGLYGRAFSLMMLPLGYVGSTLFSVLFPALAELRDDQQRFARAYLLSVELVTLVSGPIMAGMAVAAPYLIGVLYGDAWIGAVVPFQVFCAVGTFRVLALPAGAVTHAAARIEAELRRQVVYAVWVIAGAALGAWWGGIAGAAVGVATGILYKYVAVGTLSLRIGGADWPRYLRAQAPGVALAAFVAMIATLTRWACEVAHLDDLTTLLSIIGTSAVAMVGGVYLLPDWLRPRDLFQHLSRAAARLPVPARLSIRWALRSHA
jgi:PST family polysaccharide transporter